MTCKVKMAVFRRMEERVRNAELRATATERTIAEDRTTLRRLIPKLVALSGERVPGTTDSAEPLFRICVDLDPHMIRRAFTHGDSYGEIHMIGLEVGYMVSKELRTINFARYRTADVPSYPFRPTRIG
jgi:hypothetical protein